MGTALCSSPETFLKQVLLLFGTESFLVSVNPAHRTYLMSVQKQLKGQLKTITDRNCLRKATQHFLIAIRHAKTNFFKPNQMVVRFDAQIAKHEGVLTPCRHAFEFTHTLTYFLLTSNCWWTFS